MSGGKADGGKGGWERCVGSRAGGLLNASKDSGLCSWGSREPLKVLFAVITAASRTMNLAVMQKLNGNEDRGRGRDDGLWSR